jgi:hypothetical protein
MLEDSMNNKVWFIGGSMLLLMSIVGAGAHIIAHKLDQEVRQQCAEKHWAPERHDAHVDWCSVNGYAVE